MQLNGFKKMPIVQRIEKGKLKFNLRNLLFNENKTKKNEHEKSGERFKNSVYNILMLFNLNMCVHN